MCKKLGITALLLVAGLYTAHKMDVLDYARLGWRKAKSEAKAQIPPELKIERLKNEVARLSPDMNRHRSAIAAEQVEIEKLKRNIATAKANLKDREEEIRVMRTELKNNATFVTLAGKQIKKDRVEARLVNDWESFKLAEASLKGQEELLNARMENLDLAKQKLTEMKSKKEQLEVKVAQLETELRNLRLAQTKSNFQIDDSQLARCNALFAEIEDKINQEKTELELQKAEFTNDLVVPVREHIEAQKSLKELDDRFGEDAKVAAGSK